LLPISKETALEHLRIVIRTYLLATGGHIRDPLLDALKKNSLIHFQLDHRVEFEAPLGEQSVKRLGLRHGARKPVKHEATFGIMLIDAIGNDRHHDVIRDQLASFHNAFGAKANRSSRCNGGAQHIARRKLDNSVFGYQTLRLRALPRPGGPSRITLIASDLAASSA